MAGPKSKSPAAKGAGKGKKSASSGKKVDDEREETLQAVVRPPVLHSRASPRILN